MNVLLDTHTLIWFVQGDVRLPLTLRQYIEQEDIEACVSLASFWELAIKISLKKLELYQPLRQLYDSLPNYNFKILPIAQEAIFLLSDLPFHHKDPFDRLLIATAIAEDLTLVSADTHFQAYTGLKLLWD